MAPEPNVSSQWECQQLPLSPLLNLLSIVARRAVILDRQTTFHAELGPFSTGRHARHIVRGWLEVNILKNLETQVCARKPSLGPLNWSELTVWAERTRLRCGRKDFNIDFQELLDFL